MTREEKVRVLKYLRAMEEMSQYEAACWGLEDDDSTKKLARKFEAQRAEVHALAESLQAEIDEIEEMEIQVLSGKGERNDAV